MNALIFADVHLRAGPAGMDTQREFARFLRSIDPATFPRVIVLGDLFDFWFEYRHVIFSSYFESLRAFAELRDQGTELRLICGNHDFWAGRFLETELGFHVHRSAFDTVLDGQRVRFVHGDGVNKDDYGYRIYKRIARARPVVSLFRLIHPDWAMAIAQGVSQGSRKLRTPDDPSRGAETIAVERYARGVIERGEADVVVCGHSHYAVQKTFSAPDGEGLYVNTGDWMINRSYVEWKDGAFMARQFNGPLKSEQRAVAHQVPENVPREETDQTRARG